MFSFDFLTHLGFFLLTLSLILYVVGEMGILVCAGWEGDPRCLSKL